MMLNFLGQLSIANGRNTERGGYFLSVPSSAFELDRPEKSCAHVLLEHTEYGLSFKS